MEGFDPTVIMAVTALLMPVIGAFMAITPYLMRRGEVFTVTVPTSEQHDPYVVGLKRRYAVIVGSATAVFTVIGFASAAMGNAGGVLGALIVGSLAVTAGGYALMLAFRAKMSAYKAKRGWTADAQESVAVVGEQPVPRAISLKWNLLYLPIMAITFGFIAQNLLNASFMGVTLIVPLYVEGLCGETALEAGVVLLPGTVAALVLNPLAGVLTDRVGVRPVALVSGAFLATGAVLMSFLDADTPLYVTTLCQALRAVGVSGLVGPLTSWSLAQLPRSIVADGSSFCISARQACASLGTSVMVFLIAVAGASAAGLANPALAYQLAFGFSAVMAVATLGFIVAKVR